MKPTGADQIIAALIRDAFPLGEYAGAPASMPCDPEWSRVVQVAEENAVAPLLYASLKKREYGNEHFSDAIDRLRIAYLRSETVNWLALRELQSLLAEFERAPIPVIVLKGGALVTTLYPEPALRPMSDLDLLIPHAQFEQAEAILLERGYLSPIEMGEGYGPQLVNYRAYERHGKNPAHVELHWHLFKSPYYCQRVPIQWFWDRTTEIAILNQHAKVFASEAQFLHLAAHFALHHRGDPLIWSYDLARLLARDGATINWDGILDAAERFGLIPPLRLAFERTAQAWGIAIPPKVSGRMNGFRVGGRDRLAFTMMNARRDEARFLLDAFSQPTIARMARFWMQHLFPAPKYMRERYMIRDERWLPLFYVWRLVEGSSKILRSAVSMILRQ